MTAGGGLAVHAISLAPIQSRHNGKTSSSGGKPVPILDLLLPNEKSPPLLEPNASSTSPSRALLRFLRNILLQNDLLASPSSSSSSCSSGIASGTAGADTDAPVAGAGIGDGGDEVRR
ncbi:hypothetical protein HOY80DRAFT_1001104 [Tuber brumale]|nr:hypothetical protein HOY80DRAFT_1001104 [Tuber brumale]